MAKVYGLQGLVTGKLGATVFAVKNGVQLSRQYNPAPANPKTEAQIETRAKLKLLSQLSAAMANVIAIPREGLKSPRNGFTAANYQYVDYANNEAHEDLADIQLTKSAVPLAGFSADRTSHDGIHVIMNESVASTNDAIMYVVVRRADGNRVQVADSLLCREAGNDGRFAAVLEEVDGDIAVLAYGVRYNTSAARTAYGNIEAPAAQGVARLYATRRLTVNDATLTETRGLYMTSADTQGETAGVTRVNVQVNVSGPGSVSGAGRYELGSYANLVATPDADATFLGWYLLPAGGNPISTAANYTFEVTGAVLLYARFEGAPVALAVSASPAAGGTVAGGGSFAAGSSVTVRATPNSGYQFAGWYEGSTRVSPNASYTFVLSGARTLEARFEEVEGIPVAVTGYTGITIDGQSYSNGDTYVGRTGVAVSFSCTGGSFSMTDVSATVNGQAQSLSNAASGTITIPSTATRITVDGYSF